MKPLLTILLIGLVGLTMMYLVKSGSRDNSTGLASLVDVGGVSQTDINRVDQIKIPKSFLTIELSQYQALIEERLCSIEVIEEEGSLEIHFYDSNGETCDRYERNRLSSVDMNQVADSTIPLFLKRRDGLIPLREEEPVGLIQVADLINLVLQKEKPHEEVLVYPVGQQKNKVENL